MKTCKIANIFYQSGLNILPITKLDIIKLLKYVNILPKWRNIAKSGHTDGSASSHKSEYIVQWLNDLNHLFIDNQKVQDENYVNSRPTHPTHKIWWNIDI